MASSPIFRTLHQSERYRSTQSVPAHSGGRDRDSTPGQGSRKSLGFFHRSVTPSSRLRILPPSFDLPEERRALVSDYRLYKAWDQLGSKFSDVGVEDDDEIDLMTETIHRPDGTTAKLPSLDRRKRRLTTELRKTSKSAGVEEEDSDCDEDDGDEDEEEEEFGDGEGSSGAESQSIGAGSGDEEEDALESWATQEDMHRTHQEEKEAALMLTKMRDGPGIDPEEELAEFHRQEEVQRQRRIWARLEGRDSRCHTDALSGSDDESSPWQRPYSRSPSHFSTMVTEGEDDLFPEMDSDEDELAVASSSDVELDRDSYRPGGSPSEYEGTDSEDDLGIHVLERARQFRQPLMKSLASSSRLFEVSVTPEPEPKAKTRRKRRATDAISPRQSTNHAESDTRRHSKPTTKSPTAKPKAASVKSKPDKGKARMEGERPSEALDHNAGIIADGFGAEPNEPINPMELDPLRYRRIPYKQKGGDVYKTCRYCRKANPARARLSEYCRGANQSRDCTFEQDRKNEADARMRGSHSGPRSRAESDVTAPSSVTPSQPIEPSPKNKLKGVTSRGLERWRYYDKLIKKPDKVTDRSCPRCRASHDAFREEHAFYCRGRIDSTSCTYEGHKGRLRACAKEPKQEPESASKPPLPPTPVTPDTPITLEPDIMPDLTFDGSTLDRKKYYATLIPDQSHVSYRFCSDCSRSDDDSRKRLSWWCRGRITYRQCGFWDGDEKQHRRHARRSDPGPAPGASIPAVPGTSTWKAPQNAGSTVLPLPPPSILPAQPPSAESAQTSTSSNAKRRWWRDRPEQIEPTVGGDPRLEFAGPPLTTQTPRMDGNGKFCLLCFTAGGDRDGYADFCPGKVTSGDCTFLRLGFPMPPGISEIPPHGASTATSVVPPWVHLSRDAPMAIPDPPKRKRGRPRKNPLPLPQSEPIKRRTIRPRKPSLIGESTPASEPIKRKPGRPKKVRVNDMPNGASRIKSTVQNPISNGADAAAPAKSTKTITASVDFADNDTESPKKKRGRPRKVPFIEESLVKPSLDDTNTTFAVQEQIVAQSAQGSKRSRESSASTPRKKRARTFDIIVPMSRSRSPATLLFARPSTTREPTLEATNGDDAAGSRQAASDVQGHRANLGRPAPAESRSPEASLPPSSPPPSLSPSSSPIEPRRHTAAVYRSSPLAQHDRSSTGFSENGSVRPPLRGILRQSSELSDIPRSNKRVRLSLVRSPSPEKDVKGMQDDSESSDDELLLVDPNEPQTGRRSAKSSTSQRSDLSSPLDRPRAGRLPSSFLAMYASTLDDDFPGTRIAPAFNQSPSHRSTTPTASISAIRTPPMGSRSVPPPSRQSGLMLPPPVPFRLANPPNSEPRPYRPTERARTAGPISRPRSKSSSTSAENQNGHASAEHAVIRRLIDNV